MFTFFGLIDDLLAEITSPALETRIYLKNECPKIVLESVYTNISVIFHLCKVYTVITQSGTALFILAILNITRIHSVFTYMFIAQQDRYL